MCANGPLAWSVLAFNHAMIFHSYVAWLNEVINHVSRNSLMFLAFVVFSDSPDSYTLQGSYDISGGARLSSALIIRSALVCSACL